MTMKKLLLSKHLAATIAALSLILPNTSAASAMPSSWADETVSKALALHFIPDTVSHDYQNNISRIDFCSIALNFLGFQYGFYTKNAQEAFFPFDIYCTYHTNQNGMPFSMSDYTDSYFESWKGFLLTTSLFSDFPKYDPNLEYSEDEFYAVVHHPTIATQAAVVGIMQGRGQDVFDPYSPITRQEAAVILARTYAAYDGQIPPDAQSKDFVDQDRIAPWAADAVSLMSAMDVMYGLDDGRFDPLGTYTVEQCITTFYRLYKNAPTSRGKNNITPLRDVETSFSDSIPGSWAHYNVQFQCMAPNYSILVGKAQIVAGRTVNPNFMVIINNAGGTCWVDIPSFEHMTNFNWEEETQRLTIYGVYANQPDDWSFDVYAATQVE